LALAPLLEVKNLKTHFFTESGVVKAVDDVSFHVDVGETLAIVGESGSGKSITAMSILRLIPNPPGEIINGEIIFKGENILDMNDDEIMDLRGNKIAMIFQEPMTSLNPVLTVGRQIAEPIELHRKTPLSKAVGMAKDLLTKVRIAEADKRVNSYPHQFSGGMRQRVMIAMGMACEPKLIIADEPTTALDVTVQAQLLELLKELTREGSSSLILITHDLGVVARYADRINVMYGGKIVESGTALEIFERPKHPYTIGLMESIPKLDQDTKEKLIPIEGSPPNLANVPPGCAFHPRCKFAEDKCKIDTPVLEPVGSNHYKACWIDVER
jgi:oligopeptide/dipeptide ABC transporter ATP-binding protein